MLFFVFCFFFALFFFFSVSPPHFLEAHSASAGTIGPETSLDSSRTSLYLVPTWDPGCAFDDLFSPTDKIDDARDQQLHVLVCDILLLDTVTGLSLMNRLTDERIILLKQRQANL